MSNFAYQLLDIVRIGSSAIHVPMFIVSTYIMLFKTPKAMRPNNIYLLNINFWHHVIAFLCTTIARTRIENVEKSVCLSFEPLYAKTLLFDIETYALIVIACSINTGLSTLFSFLNSFHIVHRSYNYKKEKPYMILAISVVITILATFLNTILCYLCHIPTITQVENRFVYCLVESTNLYRFVEWKISYLTTLGVIVILIMGIIWRIHAYFVKFRQNLITNNVITVQQQFLRTLIIIAVVTFFSTVVPHFVVSLDMIFWSEAWSFNVIADLVPLVAIVQNVLSIFTVRPYRDLILCRQYFAKNKKVSSRS
uniref:G_PROTEIN_RECEP_F1_2 domain-containing protein n=1 Tax=Steinernema glaseri TaxID=37863 RepID=A0A1I7ZAN2_9BILA